MIMVPDEDVVAAPRPCAKAEYIGAVTLLHFSRDGSLLYVGVGATVHVYETATGALVATHWIFARGILHGLDYVPMGHGRNAAVFFGQKRLACYRDLPETPYALAPTEADGGDSGAVLSARRVGRTKVLSDWIFDVQLLTEDAPTSTSTAFPIVVVGLAHNLIQFWDPTADQLLRSVLCTERCILYSLAFYGRRASDLIVAAGTVFQQVLLWSPPPSAASASPPIVETAPVETAEPMQRLHGHDGVIFKLEWSSDARMLASVSDDRTLQLWSNDSGPEGEAFDRSAWLKRPYTSTFRAWGHTARLWDVRFCEQGILTTSEDGMCKLWTFTGDCIATMQGHMGKHVWRVATHSTAGIAATGGGDGAVKLWDLAHQIAATIPSAGASSLKVPLVLDDASRASLAGKKAAAGCVRDVVVKRLTAGSHGNDARGFVAIENGRVFELSLDATNPRHALLFSMTDKIPPTVDVSERRADVNVSSFAMDHDERHLLIGDSQGFVMIVAIADLSVRAMWKAHSTRIMKIWWNESAHGTLFTCAADGGVREWAIGDGEDVRLIGCYVGPAKCATSSVTVLDIAETRNIICGDGRGNVYAFGRPRAVQEPVGAGPLQPTVLIRGAHGRDMVSTFLVDGSGVLLRSGGHDGYICSYLINAAAGGAISLRFIGRESIKGVTTVKELSVNHREELLVFGFHATYAVLFNLTAQYRLFNVECGGWRRPHALVVTSTADECNAIPAHTFVFTPPVAKNTELHLQVHQARATSGRPFANCSLHHKYHGRMTTCIEAVGGRMVTAAEDNSLKLHKRTLMHSTCGEATWRWDCTWTGIAHTTTIRALTAFYVPARHEHIVISAGGKQRLNAWRVPDDLDVLEFLCGQEKRDSDQDHRILGLASFSIPMASDTDSTRYRLINACNSEGAIQFFLLDLGSSTASPSSLIELGECSSSKKPILSCGGVQPTTTSGYLAVGSTDGMMNVWNISPVVSELTSVLATTSPSEAANAAIQSIIQALKPAHKYLAHDMGANCLCVAQRPCVPGTFSIISGGDDQSLNVRELSIPALEVTNEYRAINASGSAIKTVSITSDGAVVYCAGYDQRIGQWALSQDDAKLTWVCSAFTECADIADLAIWSNEREDLVTVIGQGLQNVRFQRGRHH